MVLLWRVFCLKFVVQNTFTFSAIKPVMFATGFAHTVVVGEDKVGSPSICNYTYCLNSNVQAAGADM